MAIRQEISTLLGPIGIQVLQYLGLSPVVNFCGKQKSGSTGGTRVNAWSKRDQVFGKIQVFRNEKLNDQTYTTFFVLLDEITWLGRAGEPFEGARVVDNMQEGWDKEGKQMLDLWGQETHRLESMAIEKLGDRTIDNLFAEVSTRISNPLYKGICDYFSRVYSANSEEINVLQSDADESVSLEVMDSIKRDICWASIEIALGHQGFFTTLLNLYRLGRWPCSWDGEYPSGQPVLL